MLKDLAKHYYLTENYNCAEAVLKAADEAYHLGIGETGLKLAGGFGGGFGCGSTCGALAGAIAALGALAIQDRAKKTPGFKEQCASLSARFEQKAGTLLCSGLSPLYKNESGQCGLPIDVAANLLEEEISRLTEDQRSVTAL